MPLNNFGRVGHNLYRSAQPIGDDAWITLHALSVTMVYKLNGDAEYPAKSERLLISAYLGLGSGLTVDEDISPILPDGKAIVRAARQVFQLTEPMGHDEALLIHCTHGRDRTGAVIGAYRILYDSWELEDVLNELESYGVHGIIRLADTGIIEASSE